MFMMKSSEAKTHLDMFQLAFTRATEQTSHLFPSSRGSSTYLWYTAGGKLSDKNLEQRINIRFCVKISRSASDMFSLLTFAYDEYTLLKLSVFERQMQFKDGQDDVPDDQRSEQPKTQRTGANVDRVQTLVHSDRILGVRLIAEEGYVVCSEEETQTLA
jgi:hypothetical protein